MQLSAHSFSDAQALKAQGCPETDEAELEYAHVVNRPMRRQRVKSAAGHTETSYHSTNTRASLGVQPLDLYTPLLCPLPLHLRPRPPKNLPFQQLSYI